LCYVNDAGEVAGFGVQKDAPNELLVTCVVSTGTPHFERLVRRLAKQHVDLVAVFGEAVAILRADPYNGSHKHAIKEFGGRSGCRSKVPIENRSFSTV
jgi:hypothetical protein